MTKEQKERLSAHREIRQDVLNKAHWLWLVGENEAARRMERIAEHEKEVCIAIAEHKQKDRFIDRILKRSNAPKNDFSEHLDRLYPDAIKLPL